MRPIRTILVDDERIARSRLRRLLSSHEDIDIVAESADGPSALKAVEGFQPDLLFLDVQMPGMDGFEVLDSMSPYARPKAIVFVTAHDCHAVKAFETCVIDYLLKPTSAERLAKTLERVREKLEGAESDPPPIRFAIRNAHRTEFVDADQVDWIEAAGNYVILHLDGCRQMLRETMSTMEHRLNALRFRRLNRSAIVNLSRVERMESNGRGRYEVVLTNGTRIAVTRPASSIVESILRLQSE